MDFYEPCKKGQYINITKYIKDKIPYNLNKAFLCACKGGHKEIAEYMISLGANDFELALLGTW
ncbi:MAG: hypothetical protein QW478_05515 [Candidatus Micrarchaeaceae archaeon]